MNIPQLTDQEKGLICRALIESNPAFIEIIGQENGDGGRWEPFVDALTLLLGVNKWVAVSERLPDLSKEDTEDTTSLIRDFIATDGVDVFIASFDRDKNSFYLELEITHWMPMPGLPQ